MFLFFPFIFSLPVIKLHFMSCRTLRHDETEFKRSGHCYKILNLEVGTLKHEPLGYSTLRKECMAL